MKMNDEEKKYIEKQNLKDVEEIKPITLDLVKPLLGGKEDKFFYNMSVGNYNFTQDRFDLSFSTENEKYDVIGFLKNDVVKYGFAPGILYVKKQIGRINRIYQIYVPGDIFYDFVRQFYVNCRCGTYKFSPQYTNEMFMRFFNTAVKCGYYFSANVMDSEIWTKVYLKPNWNVHHLPAYVEDFYKEYKCYSAVYIDDKTIKKRYYGFIDSFIKDSFREDLTSIICWNLKYSIFDNSIYFREYFTPNDGYNRYNTDDKLIKIDFSLLPKEELSNYINIFQGLGLEQYGYDLFGKRYR